VTKKIETIVIGGGAMGSSTAWNLARRGREVVLLEQFAQGHHNGASHGATRNFSIGYAQADYHEMIVESTRLWAELGDAFGSPLLDIVGTTNHGYVDTSTNEWLNAHGIAVEMLSVDAAAERWPGIRFDTQVQYFEGGGRVRAADALIALHTQIVAHGGEVHFETPVLTLTVRPDGLVEVVTADDTYLAKTAVVTVGAWTNKLLGGVLQTPELVVTQEQPAHFAQRDESITWPSFNHAPHPGVAAYDYWYSGIYGMLTPGEGIKAGWHGTGPVVDPDHRSFEAEAVQLAALQQYARDWLPGVDADEFVAISCTYTTSPDSNFVLDRIGPIVVGAGFSGHGFKFTPSVGRILADLADGTRDAPAIFSAQR